MRRAPCPRCARPEGVPIAYGLPDSELQRRAERGDVALGGCVLFGNDPDFRCDGCGHEWPDGPLPPWWPPQDVEQMDPWDRERAGTELDRRHRWIAPVAEAVRDGSLTGARSRLGELGPDPERELEGILDGIVVPSDRVLQAEVVHAAVAVARAVTALDEETAAGEARYDALQAADDAFRRADRDFGRHGHLDVLRPAEDDDDDVDEDDWIDDEDRLRRLLATGDGEELPPVGEQWDEWLDPTALSLFDDGSARGWVRHLWRALGASGLDTVETGLDLARAQVRLVALAVLRRTLLARLDGDDVEEWRFWVDDPGIAPFHLGVLAGIEGVEPGHETGSVTDGETESDALVELVRIEAGNLARALRTALGKAPLLALTWASRYPGTRYPLTAEAMDEAVNQNLTPEKHMTYEWIDGGMELW